jgi:hypothetical protein
MKPKNQQRAEKIYPYITGVIAAFVFFASNKFLGLSFPKGQDILSATISMGSIFAGFLTTSKTLLATSSFRSMKLLAMKGYDKSLLSFLREAIFCSIAICAVGMLGFFNDPEHPPLWYGVLWTFACVTSFAAFVRITKIMLVIAESAPSNEHKNDPVFTHLKNTK